MPGENCRNLSVQKNGMVGTALIGADINAKIRIMAFAYGICRMQEQIV